MTLIDPRHIGVYRLPNTIDNAASELSATTTNPPSAITVADLDTDEMSIRFRRDANKPIVFSVICLEHYQLVDIVDEFLRKFSFPNHCFCVSYRWLIDYIKYDRIVDKGAFEIEGDDTNYQSQGGPKRSRSIDKRHSFFENICFMIKCTENNDIKMTNDLLQDLITTDDGRIITCVTQG
ncbi:unnamed protein product, partial [Rotaria sp. Silwood2]